MGIVEVSVPIVNFPSFSDISNVPNIEPGLCEGLPKFLEKIHE